MVDKDTLKIVNDALDAVKLMNREWQGLSDDEIEIIISKVRDDYYPWKDGMLFGRVARSIEQTLKEKNER